MQKLIGMTLLMIGSAAIALAQAGPAPEIDPASVTSGLVLLGGVVLVVRASRRK